MSKDNKKTSEISLASIARRGKVTQKEWDEANKDGNARKHRPATFVDRKKQQQKPVVFRGF